MSSTGLITVASAFSMEETLRRLVEAIESNALSVFARIDHTKGARDVGLELRPTELVVFGNPKSGTPLMQENQVSGIDLPVKALVWQDAEGRVWLTYNDASWLGERHGLAARPPLDAMTTGLAVIARAATSAP